MDPRPAAPSLSARLAVDLTSALLGQGGFAPGRPESRQAMGVLFDGLSRRLREVRQVALLAGGGADPRDIASWGVSIRRQSLGELLVAATAVLPRLLASWQDRRLLMISLLRGIERTEFEQFLALLSASESQGTMLRRRYLDERGRGNLTHVVLLFVEDLLPASRDLPRTIQAGLAWLQRDLNLVQHLQGLPPAVQAVLRQQSIDAVFDLLSEPDELREYLAHLDLVVDALSGYDRDELAAVLLSRLDRQRQAEACLGLCATTERLQRRIDSAGDAHARERIEHVRWIARRLSELLIGSGGATPEHYHALVLQKVLLYEEVPAKVRARVAALQVLTSFLANPQRYFDEIEGSHSPEVLEKRLWRLLGMLPNMLRAHRFDAACKVVDFARRFGASFELSGNPALLSQLRDAVTEVLAETETAQHAELMKALPQLGPAGLHLLIGVADHPDRSVRRAALDGLCGAGPAAAPALLESLRAKSGWHHLRNVLVVLGKIGAAGPEVETLLRNALDHPEALVRKEALPGLARLLGTGAADLVAARLADPDPDVRLRAIACLGVTGVSSPGVYERLAGFMNGKGGDAALAAVGVVNRLRPGERSGPRMEAALVALAGGGGWFGAGRGAHDRALRLEAIRALGQLPTPPARKALERLLKEPDSAVARAAQEALLSGS